MSDLKNLACVSSSEQKEFLDSFDEVLSDVDGVFWLLMTKIEGSSDCINHLRKSGKKIHFVSNNSTLSIDRFLKKLEKFGFKAEVHDLVIPTMAIIDYLTSVNFDKEIYILGVSSLADELSKAGFRIAAKPPISIEETAEALFANIVDNEHVGAVIVDFNLNMNYVGLQKAVTYLKRKDVLFIASAADAKYPIGPNTFIIGTRFFLDAIEELSSRKALRLSKPNSHYNDFIVRRYNIKDPKRILFIGDSISEDMQFATHAGYKKLLVLSGITNKESIENWNFPEEFKPDYYIESLGVLKDIMKNLDS